MVSLRLGQVGVEGLPAVWDLSTRPIHALVVGETGSGKSWLVRDLALQASDECEVWIADGKGGPDFVHCPASRLALGAYESSELLDEAADEVERRLAVARRMPDGKVGAPPLVLVVDELAALQVRHRDEETKAHRERRERIHGALCEIALVARAVDVHLLAALQRPDTEAIAGAARDQIGLRIALGWISVDGARMLGWGPLSVRADLAPGEGWISGYAGHQGPPQPFSARRDSIPMKPRWWRKARFQPGSAPRHSARPRGDEG